LNKNEHYAAVRRRDDIHQSVAKDVTEMFKGKITKQLDDLKTKIESKIYNQTDGVDIEYWKSFLSQLKARIAPSCVHS
jgi:Conserved mid region of cactin